MKVFLSSSYKDLIKHRKAKRGTPCPPDDEPSGYAYKVRSYPFGALSGLADLGRLRNTSTGVHPRAEKRPRDIK